jgi:hypothetical protein
MADALLAINVQHDRSSKLSKAVGTEWMPNDLIAYTWGPIISHN